MHWLTSGLIATGWLVLGLVCLGLPAGRARVGLRPNRAGWMLVAAEVGLLGIDRVSGLVGDVTLLGRNVAREAGVYGERRGWQVVALGLVAGLILVIWSQLWRAHPRGRGSVLRVAAALTMAGTYLLVKLVSLHFVDRFLALRFYHLSFEGAVQVVLFGSLGGLVAYEVAVIRTLGVRRPRGGSAE